MSTKINWNKGWEFTKKRPEEAIWDRVDLPHTWNGKDGQDGGDDYFRGTCYYRKTLSRSELPEGKDIYLEFQGVNSSAVLFVNGTKVTRHDGGYSTWRADFTFYGGIYRDVNLIFAEKTRFDLDYYGSPGVKVTPQVDGTEAKVTVEVFLTGIEGGEILEYQILEGDSVIEELVQTAAVRPFEEKDSEKKYSAPQQAVLTIRNVRLWNGRKDPYLYLLQVRLIKEGKESDRRVIPFGCRSFSIDPEKGFLLNGKPYPLHGVSRHQDRPKIGNALRKEHHDEDMDLISELGANSIRLAHYQHDQYFYELCDRKGMIVWAEIPYISRHLENGYDNTIRQMRELICQNYNHPCIAVWGLSNEITMGAGADEELLRNHHVLNDLAHRLDKTRLTTEAVVTMYSIL